MSVVNFYYFLDTQRNTEKHSVLTGHQALQTHKLWEFYLQAESQATVNLLYPMFWKSLGSWTEDTGHDTGEILVSQWPQSCAFPLHRSACKLPGSFPCVIWNWGRDFKTEAGQSRLAGGSFNKQRKLTYRLVLCGSNYWQMNPHNHQPNLRRGPNWAQSRMPCPCFQHHITIWRLCPWSSHWEPESKWNSHSKDRGSSEEPLSA